MNMLLGGRRQVVRFILLAACAASAPAVAETDPTYAALRALRPQGESVSVQGLSIERDVFRFQFDSGAFQFLTLADGRTVGAVFVGEGGFELRPALDCERRQLALVTGEKDLTALSDRFNSVVFLFTDDTAAQIRKAASAAGGGAVSKSADVYDAFLRKQHKQLRSNLQVRLLGDLLADSPPGGGMFLAFVTGKKYPPSFLIVDPASLTWFAPHTLLSGEETTLYAIGEKEPGFWYLAHRKSEPAHVPSRQATTRHYRIETTVKSNSGIRGVATLEIKPLLPGIRVLPLRLMGRLRIQEAGMSESSGGPWKPLGFAQEAAEEDSDPALVFPQAPAIDKSVFVRLVYEGKDVLRDVGDGNFVVSARESWYPNLETFSELSTFDLIYRYPRGNEVVSVGRPIENTVEGDLRVSVWKAEKPIRVAGFNYGRFKKIEREDKESGLHVEVFTNPGTPDVINEINSLLRSRSGQTPEIGSGSPIPSDLDNPFVRLAPSAGLSRIQIDTDGLAESAMADAINTGRVCSLLFGRLSEPRLAITQQAQWAFGQSWPSLVFLPYLAALDGTTRHELGLKDTSDFIELVGPHEVAHQWWGHLVGWDSYRDQWLSEGLAEFTAAMVVQRTGGPRRFQDYWEKARRRITGKPRQSALANDQAGPISQGVRLATSRSPGAYEAMVYAKGAYVFHMLRMLMRGEGSNPDEAFIALMKDYVASFSGKNPSTRDFQTVVERHMIPNMNATGDGKMDWFFRQWVTGMEIPRLREKLEVSSKGGNEYRISGTVSQEGVSADFRTLDHLYLEFAKGEVGHLGVIPLIGSTTKPVDFTVRLPKAPKRVLLNTLHDVLSRD